MQTPQTYTKRSLNDHHYGLGNLLSISPAWVNLRQCIEYQCTPFPWIYDPTDLSWHDAACDRHDTDVVDIQIAPWVYVSFRGNEMKHFPDYSTITDILRDTSLESKGLAIQAFVCCNIHEVKARHFWLLEVQNHKRFGGGSKWTQET